MANFTWSCSGLLCSFDGSSSTGSGLTYAWNFGDGATGSGVTTTHSYASTGRYFVTLTVTDNASPPQSDSKTRRVRVK